MAAAESRGNQAQASQRPLPVESHRTRQLPPVTKCDHTQEMRSIRELLRDSESRIFCLFLRFYLFIFREGGREEQEGEKRQCAVASHAPLLGTWPATQACALTGNRTSDLLVCRPVLNPLSHTSQGQGPGFLLEAGHLSTVCLTWTKAPDSQKERRWSTQTTLLIQTA